MRTYAYAILAILVIAITAQISLADAQIQEVNHNSSVTSSPANAQLAVRVLKYSPYPVNPGDWFDVWVEVQNVGQEDAKHTIFELRPEYPFLGDSNDSLTQSYGSTPGVVSANQIGMLGDANEVILKYRVKAADNAPEGVSYLKFAMVANENDPQATSTTSSFPISIAKTKTDFDVVMQDSTAQGISFAIANTGENAATAVKVSVEPQDSTRVTGTSASIIGNLAAGDFTTVTFQIAPNKNLNQLKLQIAYTDAAGIRNTVEKIVAVNSVAAMQSLNLVTSKTRTATSSSRYIYLVAGVVLGFVLTIVYKKLRRKVSENKK